MTASAVQHDPGAVSPDLLALTLSLGREERDLIIIAEGNTSERIDPDHLVVKASGSGMATATVDDFVVADIAALAALLDDPAADQVALTAALDAGVINGRQRRGSIEALVHVSVQALSPNATATRFVGHTHPTQVVGLLASVHAEHAWDRHVYSDEAVVIGQPLFVPYAMPGIALGKVFHSTLRQRVAETGVMPSLILLGNHGIVAIGPTADAVDGISAMAVKGAQVRTIGYSVGGVAPLSEESVDKFIARADIAERVANISQGSL